MTLRRGLLALLAMTVLSAKAKHFPCSPGVMTKNHVLWCNARFATNGYYCRGSDKGVPDYDQRVADWNRIGPNQLEFGRYGVQCQALGTSVG